MRTVSCATKFGIFDGEHRKIVTDKLRSYGVAHRELVTMLDSLQMGGKPLL
jgi:hypothetical protein